MGPIGPEPPAGGRRQRPAGEGPAAKGDGPAGGTRRTNEQNTRTLIGTIILANWKAGVPSNCLRVLLSEVPPLLFCICYGDMIRRATYVTPRCRDWSWFSPLPRGAPVQLWCLLKKVFANAAGRNYHDLNARPHNARPQWKSVIR